jgi:hypothetical protein
MAFRLLSNQGEGLSPIGYPSLEKRKNSKSTSKGYPCNNMKEGTRESQEKPDPLIPPSKNRKKVKK